MEIQFTCLAASPLVRCRPRLMAPRAKVLFVTISPNAKTVITLTNSKGKKIKSTYGAMPQKFQYKYCLNAFKQLYLKDMIDPCFVGTWELNKQSNVHFHFLVVTDTITTDYELKMFQRDVYNHEITLKNLHKGKGFDRMNHIVFMTKPIHELINYLDKDYDDKTKIMLSKDMRNYCDDNVYDDIQSTTLKQDDITTRHIELSDVDSEDSTDSLISMEPDETSRSLRKQ